jgi:HSP20 family molecular chaperone IbpA
MNAKKAQLGLDSCAESLTTAPACKRRVADTDWFPAVDVYDAGNEYLFEFDLPGLKREQIQISMERDALLLVGTRLSPQPGGTSLRVERPVGAFVRRLVLPPDSCSDEIYATLQEGILQLHLPKNNPHKENEESRTNQSEKPDHEYIHR